MKGDEKEKIDLLYDKMEKLESLLNQVIHEGKIINIENIDIQGPMMENLEFKFDKIDINEVSGALNIGNNFGVRVDQSKKNASPSKASAKKGQTSEKTESKTVNEFEKRVEEKLKEIFSKKIEQEVKRKHETSKPKVVDAKPPVEKSITDRSNKDFHLSKTKTGYSCRMTH